MLNAYISGTGMYVPPRVVTNDDLREQYGMDTSDEWIRQRTGIEQRHFADEGLNTTDMAEPAARQAIENAGLKNKDIDMIIFATLSPDRAFPGNAVYLQDRLGMCDEGHFPACLDVRNQCSGFVYALSTATAFIRSGVHKHILVVGAETHSPAIDLSTRGRTVASLFGDAGGAVVVSATEEDRGIRSWNLGADGRHADALRLNVWNMKKRPYMGLGENDGGTIPLEDKWPYMEGKVVFRHAVERMIGTMMQSFATEGLTLNDVDLFLFHQANLRINQHIQKTIGAPDEKFMNNIQRLGNTTAATIPTLMHEAVETGKLKPGNKVALVAFGSGFTWGSMILDW